MWSGSRDTFWNFTLPEISLQRLKLETSNFVYYLAASSISLVMPDYPPSGHGQGHMTHFYILGPGHIFGADEATHFTFGLQTERKRVLALHMSKFCTT